MSPGHLSEREIQEYLDRVDTCNFEAIETHLAGCGKCRDMLAQYKAIYSGLKNDDWFSMSNNFAVKMTERIESEAMEEKRSRVVYVVAGIIMSILSFSSIHYFLGWEWIAGISSKISSTDFKFMHSTSSFVLEQVRLLNGKLTIILAGVVIVLFYGLLDKLMLRHRYKYR